MKLTLVFLLSLWTTFSFAEDLKVEYIKIPKAAHAVAKKMTVTSDDYYQLDAVAKEVLDFCKRKGLKVISPRFGHGLLSKASKDDVAEVEVGYEVATPLAKKEGDFYPTRTMSGKVAVHTYVGPYENEMSVTSQLERQLEAQGKKVDDTSWTFYPNLIGEVPKEKLESVIKFAYSEKNQKSSKATGAEKTKKSK